MENSKESAFLVAAVHPNGDSVYNPGLTKREYFAAMAMQGLLSDQTYLRPNNDKQIAEASIKIADELLKQLENE